MSDRIARRIVARGRVQGVFFRNSLRGEAQRVGITGWVRNRDDGAVEAHLEGPEAAVLEIVELCRAGPGNATVDGLEVAKADREGHTVFAIHRDRPRR